MNDIITDYIEDEKPKKKNSKTKKVAAGLDIGTMTIILSRSDKSNKSLITRNMFLKVDEDESTLNEFSDISYIKSDDGIFIIGDDAFKMAIEVRDRLELELFQNEYDFQLTNAPGSPPGIEGWESYYQPKGKSTLP